MEFFLDVLDPSTNPFQLGIDIGNTVVECKDCDDTHKSFVVAIHLGYFSIGFYTI